MGRRGGVPPKRVFHQLPMCFYQTCVFLPAFFGSCWSPLVPSLAILSAPGIKLLRAAGPQLLPGDAEGAAVGAPDGDRDRVARRWFFELVLSFVGSQKEAPAKMVGQKENQREAKTKKTVFLGVNTRFQGDFMLHFKAYSFTQGVESQKSNKKAVAVLRCSRAGPAFRPQRLTTTATGGFQLLELRAQSSQSKTTMGPWWSTPMGSQFGWQVHSPPILGPILVGIGMFNWGYDLGFDP